MKKLSLYLMIFSLFKSLSACQVAPSSSINTDSHPSDSTKISAELIHLPQLREKLANKETFYLYIGRPTCSYCRNFEPKLQEAMKETQVPVFYLNTDAEDEVEVTIFVDTQGIETIPHLTYYREGQKGDSLTKGSESTIYEIQLFLNNAL